MTLPSGSPASASPHCLLSKSTVAVSDDENSDMGDEEDEASQEATSSPRKRKGGQSPPHMGNNRKPVPPAGAQTLTKFFKPKPAVATAEGTGLSPIPEHSTLVQI